ncbi:mCG146952 [Mus musculus]|nr:mCG146952 [Mus musculus]
MSGGEYSEPTEHHNFATQSTAEYWLLMLGKNGPLGAVAGCLLPSQCCNTEKA